MYTRNAIVDEHGHWDGDVREDEDMPDTKMPTEKYLPWCGTEGADFMARWCDKCKREAKYRQTQDGEDGCPIVLKSLLAAGSKDGGPDEWTGHDHTDAKCSAFEPEIEEPDPKQGRLPL